MTRETLVKSIGAGALMAALAACGASGGNSSPSAAVQTQPASAPPSVSVSAVLPQGFPGDFPTYAGARVKVSATVAAEAFTVAWSTTDPADRVIAFYRERLARGDWQIMMDTTATGTGALLVFSRKSNPQSGGTVTIAGEQGGTEIAVVLGKGIPRP